MSSAKPIETGRRQMLALVVALGLSGCGGGGGGGSTAGSDPPPGSGSPPPPPPSPFTLGVAVSGSGSVASTPAGIDCGANCSGSYATGTSVTLTATAASGNHLSTWGGACSGNSTTCTVSMTAARSVSATFMQDAAPPGTATSVSQYGITWNFDSAKTVGQFANGDYWVLGPVTITGITPDFNPATKADGWQVNPVSGASQSYDGDGAYYQAALMPSLPYTAQPGASIVKVISLPKPNAACSAANTRSCLKSAAVLTVLGAVPPDSGTTVFRPPYFGTDKPLFSTTDMDANWANLPRLTPTPEVDAHALSLAAALEHVKRVNIVHIPSVSEFYPEDNAFAGQPNPYAPGVSNLVMEALLRTLLVKAGDSETQRRQVAVAVIQRGIDVYGARAGGIQWPADGGTNTGMKEPITFAGVMLNNSLIKDTVINSARNDFADSGTVQPTRHASVPDLFGQDRGSEADYWDAVRAGNDAQNGFDPYFYIDGGGTPGTVYDQCCITGVLKEASLVVHLIHGMQPVWNDDASLNYVERWITRGVWTQPDPCAPPAQGGGPNPARPGECILDPDLTPGSTFTSFSCQAGKQCGRFPGLHGMYQDRELWVSELAQVMWPAYRTLW